MKLNNSFSCITPEAYIKEKPDIVKKEYRILIETIDYMRKEIKQ